MHEGDEHEDDPFDGWTLDDAFVAAATVPEASAEERVRRPEPVAPSRPQDRTGHRARRRRGRRRTRARQPGSPGGRAVTAAIGVLVAVLVAAVARDALVGREPQP